MATPARNDRTLRIRELAKGIREEESESWEEETPRPGTIPDTEVPYCVPTPRSLPQQAKDQWQETRPWLKAAAILVPILAGAAVQIIEAWKH